MRREFSASTGAVRVDVARELGFWLTMAFGLSPLWIAGLVLAFLSLG